MLQISKLLLFVLAIFASTVHAQSANAKLGGMTGFLDGMNQGLLQSQQQENIANDLENQRLQLLNQNKLLELKLQQMTDENRREQEALNQAVATAERNATDPRLLPLAAPNGGLKRSTENLIFSSLIEALNFTNKETVKQWRNSENQAVGTVWVSAQKNNSAGVPCRTFVLTHDEPSAPSRTLNGLACKDQWNWRWLSGMR